MAAKKEKTIEKVDILNRTEFIDRVINLVKLVSSHKGNTTFAINGEWGCGKTFVLNEIQKRLDNDESKQYLVIPYNCWQYDYYDEPLVAIVSALLDFAESTNIIPEDMKITLKEIAVKVGFGIATRIIKNKIGDDVAETVKDIKDAISGTKEGIDAIRDFDSYYSFKKALKDLQDQLRELAENHTIVLAVDELDRCLPEYAIKVLERLHHITEGMPNMITIFAVDKERLNHTVSSIFGTENVNNYLKKFVRFEIKLDKGKQNGPKFFERFPDFYERFDPEAYGELNNTEQFLDELLSKLEIRTREQVVERASIINDICFGETKQDHSVMYMELFFSALYYGFKVESIFKSKKSSPENKRVFANYKDCADVFNLTPSGFSFSKNRVIVLGVNGIPIDTSNVFMLAFYYWYNLPFPKIRAEVGANEVFPHIGVNDIRKEKLAENLAALRKFLEIMHTIG